MKEKESREREYQFCLLRVQQLEADFVKLRKGLLPEQQALLDDYISACEALSEAESELCGCGNPLKALEHPLASPLRGGG